jgi:hypothetical protein
MVSFRLLNVIAPLLMMSLLLLTVTAVVLAAAGVMLPDGELMVMSEGAPLLAVAVWTGVVVAVEIVTWAAAGSVKTSGAAAPSSSRTLNVMKAVYS